MGSIGKAWIFSCMMLFGLRVHAWNNSSLIPPSGNSLMMKVRTDNGRQMYKCMSKQWVFSGTAADLILAEDNSVRVGVHKAEAAGGTVKETWTFQNPLGDEAESGYKYSTVSGEEIFSGGSDGSISEALLKATSHQAQGRASLVSYIQRLFPKGGQPPVKEACDQDSAEVEVPYEAQYWIWHQDLAPPSAIPSSLAVSSERVVQGLYGEGMVYYRFTEDRWERKLAEADLYNVPGGLTSGKYSFKSSKSTGEVHKWRFFNPNGFDLLGKPKCPPVAIDNHSLPWSLVAINSHSGNESVLGEYSHVQIVSTRGGEPSNSPYFKPVPGLIWKAPFSAVFWFYAN